MSLLEKILFKYSLRSGIRFGHFISCQDDPWHDFGLAPSLEVFKRRLHAALCNQV